MAQLQHVEQLSQMQALSEDDKIFINYLHQIHSIDISTGSDMKNVVKNGIGAILKDASEHYQDSTNPLVKTCIRLLHEVAETRMWTINLSMQYIELVERNSRNEMILSQAGPLILGLQAWWQRVQGIYHKLSK